MAESIIEAASTGLACTLSNADLSDRVRAWTRVSRRALVGRSRHPLGIVLRYRKDLEIESELRQLVCLENDCCSFLSFQFTDEPEHLVLTVTGPAEAASLIQQCWGLGS